MKSIETIYQEMATVFSEETGLALDGTGEPSVRLWALAAQVYGLYEECAWTLAQCFPQTAAGEALDRHAALRGLARRDAARAEGTLTFSVRQAALVNILQNVASFMRRWQFMRVSVKSDGMRMVCSIS